MYIYKKFTKVDIDYMMYFNLDYLHRPKNFINELVEKALHGINNVVVYASKISAKYVYNDKKKIVIVNKKLKKSNNFSVTYNYLYGLGSIFYFNKLKNLSLKDKDIEVISLKNIKYLERESKK